MIGDALNTAEVESVDELAEDVVCGCPVDVEVARQRDLILDFAEREYAFCGHACRDRFARAPSVYAIAGRSAP